MTNKKDEFRLKVGICVDKEVHEKSLLLRSRHNVNVSALCRNAILAEFDRLQANMDKTHNGGLL